MKKKMFGLVGVILLALMISPIVSHAEDLDAAQNEESATEGTIVMKRQKRQLAMPEK